MVPPRIPWTFLCAFHEQSAPYTFEHLLWPSQVLQAAAAAHSAALLQRARPRLRFGPAAMAPFLGLARGQVRHSLPLYRSQLCLQLWQTLCAGHGSSAGAWLLKGELIASDLAEAADKGVFVAFLERMQMNKCCRDLRLLQPPKRLT